MRLFWVPLVIVVLFAVDRAYMDGQNADQLMSLARWAGAFYQSMGRGFVAASEIGRPNQRHREP
jgi:hypothetical protein